MEALKTQNCQSNLEEKRTKPTQASDNTTKLQSSKQHGTGTKTDSWVHGTE